MTLGTPIPADRYLRTRRPASHPTELRWSGHGGTRTHLEHIPRTIGRRPTGSGSATWRPAGSIVPVGKVHTGAPGVFGCASVLPLLESAACRVAGPRSAGRGLRLHKSAGRRDDCHNSAGCRLEERITYLFPGILSLGILAVTRRHTLFRHFHTKWME
jgi:hypothetical protein